jgi:hypothetical protein
LTNTRRGRFHPSGFPSVGSWNRTIPLNTAWRRGFSPRYSAMPAYFSCITGIGFFPRITAIVAA